MSNEHTVLVLVHGDDPQLRMLKDLPHIVGGEKGAFAKAV